MKDFSQNRLKSVRAFDRERVYTFSQNKEDVFVLSLFDKPGFFLELGAGDGYHFSNCRLLRENGWEGLSVDIDNKRNPEVMQVKIDMESVINLLAVCPSVIDFLSIDLDGNDYWILETILNISNPKCICLEVNSQLPKDKALVINYDPDRIWDGSYAYGMSYKAAFDLMNSHGYQVIKSCNHTNLIAVKNIIGLSDCGSTWSHPENMPKGSYFNEIVTLNKK